MDYSIEDGEWVLRSDGRTPQKMGKAVGVLYDKGPTTDVLIKHGPWSVFEPRPLGMCELNQVASDLRLVRVPAEDRFVSDLNNVLSISASRWPSRLEEAINKTKSG